MSIKAGLAMMGVLTVLSFTASAAQSINSEQAQGMHSIGVITVSGINSAPSDINQQLNSKADAMGARAYEITENYMNGNYHATTVVFK